MRNKNGVKYSVRSIFITPVIYLVLSAYFLIGLQPYQDAIVICVIVVGILVGMLLGKRSELFEKDGKVLYKRSVEVMAIWIVGFVLRIVADFFFNPALTSYFSPNSLSGASASAAAVAYQSSLILLGVDLLLAFSAGLLLGEALILYMNHRKRYSSG